MAHGFPWAELDVLFRAQPRTVSGGPMCSGRGWCLRLALEIKLF